MYAKLACEGSSSAMTSSTESAREVINDKKVRRHLLSVCTHFAVNLVNVSYYRNIVAPFMKVESKLGHNYVAPVYSLKFVQIAPGKFVQST